MTGNLSKFVKIWGQELPLHFLSFEFKLFVIRTFSREKRVGGDVLFLDRVSVENLR